MVGKPNFPPNADERDDLMGMSMPTPGLTPLDQEREASMADEGGTSGAVMESQDGDTERDPTSNRPYPNASGLPRARFINPRIARASRWLALGAVTGLALAAFTSARRRR